MLTDRTHRPTTQDEALQTHTEPETYVKYQTRSPQWRAFKAKQGGGRNVVQKKVFSAVEIFFNLCCERERELRTFFNHRTRKTTAIIQITVTTAKTTMIAVSTAMVSEQPLEQNRTEMQSAQEQVVRDKVREDEKYIFFKLFIPKWLCMPGARWCRTDSPKRRLQCR